MHIPVQSVINCRPTRVSLLRVFLQHTTTHCNTLQHTATHCNTLQHTATHCNTLHRTATHSHTLQHTSTHCNTLQHTATPCNTLHHTATHCNPYLNIQHTWRMQLHERKQFQKLYLHHCAIKPGQCLYVLQNHSKNKQSKVGTLVFSHSQPSCKLTFEDSKVLPSLVLYGVASVSRIDK